MNLPLSRTSTLEVDKSAVFAGLPSKAGLFSDADFTAPRDGDTGINTTAGQPEFRSGGNWMKVPIFSGHFAAAVVSGALTPNQQNVCDATIAPLTMTLPTGQPVGTWIEVEKADGTVNTVTISGNIRGAGSSSLTLSLLKEGILFVVDVTGSWAPFADYKTLSSLDARYAGAGSGGGLSGGVANGTVATALANETSAAPNNSGFVFKRSYSTTPTTIYGAGQGFEVYSPSTQLASDNTGDYGGVSGGAGGNPVLWRADMFGGLGTVQGMHFAPGLRNTYGGGVPLAIWIQLGSGAVDVPGIIISMPPTVSAMVQPAIVVENSTGTDDFFTVGKDGTASVYDSAGSAAAIMYAGTTPTSGYRALFAARGTTVTALGLQNPTGSTANIMTWAVGSAIKGSLGPTGAVVMWDDTVAIPLASLLPGTSPGSGARANFLAGAAAVVPLRLTPAAGQTAFMFQNMASDGVTPKSGFNAFGSLVMWDDTAANALGNIFTGTTPASGYRASFYAGASTITPLLLQQAVSQSVPMYKMLASDGSTVFEYVDSNGMRYLKADPISALGAATKQYVDNKSNELFAPLVISADETTTASAGAPAMFTTTDLVFTVPTQTRPVRVRISAPAAFNNTAADSVAVYLKNETTATLVTRSIHTSSTASAYGPVACEYEIPAGSASTTVRAYKSIAGGGTGTLQGSLGPIRFTADLI